MTCEKCGNLILDAWGDTPTGYLCSDCNHPCTHKGCVRQQHKDAEYFCAQHEYEDIQGWNEATPELLAYWKLEMAREELAVFPYDILVQNNYAAAYKALEAL